MGNISGVISPKRVISAAITLLITLLITTHEPPSRDPLIGVRTLITYRLCIGNPKFPKPYLGFVFRL